MEVRVNDGTSQAPVDTNTQLLVMRLSLLMLRLYR